MQRSFSRVRPSALVASIGIVAAAFAWLAPATGAPEQRQMIANVAFTAFAAVAVIGCAFAVSRTEGLRRAAWVWVLLGAVSWAAAQLAWDLYDVAGVQLPIPSDAGYLAAAPLFIIGLALFVTGSRERLAVPALLLDVGAVVMTLLSGLALFVTDRFAAELARQPLSVGIAILYPVLYVGATGAALSALWGRPYDEPRRASLWLLVGMAALALGFTLWLPSYVLGSSGAGTVLDPLWMLGMLGVGVAGLAAAEDGSRRGDPAAGRSVVQLSRMLLPGAVAVLAAYFLIASQLDRATATDPVVAATVAAGFLLLAIRAGLAIYANSRLGEDERRRAEEFRVLYDVGLATAREQSLDELTQRVAAHAAEITRCDGAMLSLVEPGRGLVVAALHNAPEALRGQVGQPPRGIARAAAAERDLVIATDYADHPSANPQLLDEIASALSVPLISHGDLLGTLTAYSRTRRRFDAESQRLVRLYAAQAATAIENTRLLEQTRRLARDDELTGLVNRRVLMERIEEELREASRHGDAFCVVLCDVDGLKAVNDSAGHLVGNEVLRQIAQGLREPARGGDVVARFGGDEFVLLLPRTPAIHGEALVVRIASRLRDETYVWGGVPRPLPRVSFGLASFPDDGRTADALIAAADERMYADKSQGRRASGMSG